MWNDLYAPDYSTLGAAAHRVLASKTCRFHPRRRGLSCRRCRYVLEMHRQAAARALALYWPVWEAKRLPKFRAAAAASLKWYWREQADAARALEMYWEHWRDRH